MALTEEDKQWVLGELKRVETGLEAKLDRVERNIERMETNFEAKLERVERNIERMETNFEAKLERVETNLLTAFHRWASPAEMRQRSHSLAIKALDEEMEALQERVKKLEA